MIQKPKRKTEPEKCRRRWNQQGKNGQNLLIISKENWKQNWNEVPTEVAEKLTLNDHLQYPILSNLQ